jgi:PDZ domain-containing protein
VGGAPVSLAGGLRSQSEHGASPRGVTVVVCAFAFVVCVAVMGLVHAPYAILSPGPATNTLGDMAGQKLIQVTGRATYPTKGALYFTTVRIYGGPGTRVGLFTMLQGWLNHDSSVIPEEEEFPKGQTSQQIQQQDAQDMTTSQQDAAAAALRELGITVPETVTIAALDSSAPAAKVLHKGDVITSIDGVAITSNAQLHDVILGHKAGDVLKLRIKRGGTGMTVSAPTTESGGRTVLGITPGITFDMPFTVRIDTRDVGGPSAGTMFALGVYDALTPGSLTGGQRIAGTGTIDPETGDVGIIGGIAQKMVGAKDAGAQWFLAPVSNCSDVVGHVPSGLHVVKVATLHQARLDVQAIAAGNGSGLPGCG